MTAISDLNDWLGEAGYKHHVFISWPHSADEAVRECAHNLRKDLEKNRLGAHFYEPKVFFDERSIEPGETWPDVIKEALCRSVVMIAVWSSMYFEHKHRWCGLEWATMRKLSLLRLGRVRTIIPVKAREPDAIPARARVVETVDFTEAIGIPSYYTSPEFCLKAEGIAKSVRGVAEELMGRNAGADCAGFAFPTRSAFPKGKKKAPPLLPWGK